MLIYTMEMVLVRVEQQPPTDRFFDRMEDFRDNFLEHP